MAPTKVRLTLSYSREEVDFEGKLAKAVPLTGMIEIELHDDPAKAPRPFVGGKPASFNYAPIACANFANLVAGELRFPGASVVDMPPGAGMTPSEDKRRFRDLDAPMLRRAIEEARKWKKDGGQGGFYDGLAFHRLVPDFVMQGGDPRGDGRGGPGYSIADDKEFGHNWERTVAMANAGPNTAGSQFFINLKDSSGGDLEGGLDGKHVVFGHVVSGWGVVQEISLMRTGPGEKPVGDVRIMRAEIMP